MGSTPRSYLAEFLGTFTLVFVGTSVATLQGFSNGGQPQPAGWLGISFAFGFTLMVLVWAFGPVSGCHLNPAVSVPMAIAGRLPWKLLPGYVIAQCLGAIVASFTLLQLLTGLKIGETSYDVAAQGLGANGPPKDVLAGPITLFGYEMIMTALFLYVIFTVTRKNHPAGFAALAIGVFLFVAHLIGVPLGDSSLNPARSLGPALVQGGNALNPNVLGIFLVAPLVGGVIGWAIYTLLHDKEK
jgi:aquaporin Z